MCQWVWSTGAISKASCVGRWTMILRGSVPLRGPLRRRAARSTLCPDANSKLLRNLSMKTALLMSAAALAMCVGSAAAAKTVSISFDGLCDGMDIIVNGTDRTALETGNGCDQGAHFGAGTIG